MPAGKGRAPLHGAARCTASAGCVSTVSRVDKSIDRILTRTRIAVKPPEYLPRLSYFALMQSVDVFVVGDTFQYSRQSYQNRTRIRTPQGWHWLSIPLVGRQHGRPINRTAIDNRTFWRSKHQRSFIFNYSQTAFYAYLEASLKNLLDREWGVLGNLTCQSITLLHKLLQLNCRLVFASALPGCPASLEEVLEAMPASTLYTDRRHEVQGITNHPVQYFKYREPNYRQHFEGFEPNISTLDLLCNYGPEASGVLRPGV